MISNTATCILHMKDLFTSFAASFFSFFRKRSFHLPLNPLVYFSPVTAPA